MAHSEPVGGTPQGLAFLPDRVALRRAALVKVKSRYAALRKVHQLIAADLSRLKQKQVDLVVKRALQTVEAWERAGVASPYYGRAWRRILEDPADRIPKMLRGKNANALVQNSPFGFLFRKPKYRDAFQGGIAHGEG
jgi:hypothetical protein